MKFIKLNYKFIALQADRLRESPLVGIHTEVGAGPNIFKIALETSVTLNNIQKPVF